MARTPAASINHLSMAQKLKLGEFTRDWYAKLNLTDAAFAAEAEKSLGFKITSGNISGMREALEIPSTKTVKAASSDDARFAALERRVAELEAALARTDGTMGR